ncbi:E3 ubiquitin-protein ligase RFWD3-like [Pyrus ussuriensis x Pyrus communis]|uniref:E3 ubiquitin-protein ligase RFWD3-like n=1 Tax=Pyrus ussuriensis x Pyrus communis TaxID=2448454 RepID=A0A5N5F5F9_9ROSA|nr:E3 ubiquitin-protein ligase RFWD3-like [Pyrus ussuriensis x Pyrus communis]
MSTSEPSDSVMAMLIDGEDDQEVHELQTDARTPIPKQRREISPSLSSNYGGDGDEGRRKKVLALSDTEGLFCPICMEAWESQGDHQKLRRTQLGSPDCSILALQNIVVSPTNEKCWINMVSSRGKSDITRCLPCGHVYGLSCIRRWIQQHGGIVAKCPQCNSKYNLKDIIKLFGSPIVVLDESLLKKVRSYEAEVASLKTERASLLAIQDDLFRVQENLFKELTNQGEKLSCRGDAASGEKGIEQRQSKQWDHHSAHNFLKEGILHCKFHLECELAVEGARLFDMDASSQTLVLARRISGLGGTHMLKKVNLMSPQQSEDIQLPPGTKPIKDLHVSPCGRFTLLASLGKKLSFLSLGSNSFVITYDLPDGLLLMFDMRFSKLPLLSLAGLTSRPIHTIHSLVQNRAFSHTSHKLLTSSSSGPCVWNMGSAGPAGERPFLIPGLEDQGVCTSVAYSPSTDNIVASYHPKTDTSARPSGSQVLIKRVDDCFYHKIGSVPVQLNDFQLRKSAIVDIPDCYPLFAYGEELTRGLWLRELPSLKVSQNLEPHQHSILDVKYARSQDKGLLGCLSEDKLQLFSAATKGRGSIRFYLFAEGLGVEEATPSQAGHTTSLTEGSWPLFWFLQLAVSVSKTLEVASQHFTVVCIKEWSLDMETMSVNTGNSHSNKRQASEHSETTSEEKRPAVKEVSTPVFVNHAAIAWHERRKKWVGNQRVQRAEKDPIISWSTSYEDLLSTNESFPEPIPLTEMVDFLVDIWHDEDIQKEEKAVHKTIREAAKRNDMATAKALAKEIVMSRKVVNRLHENKAQLNSISMHLGESVALARTVGHLSKSTEVMKLVNNLMKAPEMAITMHEFTKEITKAGVIEEFVDDALDTALDSEDIEEETEEEVERVLSEIAGETAAQLPEAVRKERTKVAAQRASTSQEEAIAEGADNEEELEVLRARLAQPSSYALTADNHRGMRNRHALPRAGVRLCCKAKAIYSILTVTIFGILAELGLLLVLLTDLCPTRRPYLRIPPA